VISNRYNANLENQITEIREIFDNITSTLKAKASKNSGTYRTLEQQEVILAFMMALIV